ncbi:hypothetical protein [Alkalihalobacterium alkalinitrilicum]|uniref:hypothetical protein n=1 Tax=Alkalihalobacterium alkalinitrilicum TaxID=427920 RepID=UPI000994C6B1|nr:hypothetical protein [Alkalihalobacterium alkalinitrilicum]
MQLQQFVTEIIEEIGGFVEPIEYALCNVLIPEDYISHFQNRAEICLAFDFEVAQENPEAEFVTFGSYILEQLLAIVQEQAVSTLRFVEVERLELGNPLKKISDYLMNESGKLTIVEERPILGIWAVFNYQITYVSDERIETSDQVWINLLTNEVSSTMKKDQNRIIYKHEALYNYPIPIQIDLSKSLEVATKYVKQKGEQQNNQVHKLVALEKDVTRITNYYTELLNENEKRASRKGLSDEKKKEITTKSAAIELEKDKQLQEIHNKYNVQTEINLDNGILYFIPLLEFTLNIEFRGTGKKKIIYYNPITKKLFEGNS